MLRPFPVRNGIPVGCSAFFGEAVNAFAVASPPPYLDVFLLAQAGEPPRQRRDRDTIVSREIALRDLASLVNRLQNDELCSLQPRRSQHQIVELRDRPGGSSQCREHGWR